MHVYVKAATVKLFSHGPFSGRTPSCRQLPGHWVLWNLSDKTLTGWRTATVAEQWLSPKARGTLPCSWVAGVTV
jgi:hypothetical protein